jgi:hypothetical protein
MKIQEYAKGSTTISSFPLVHRIGFKLYYPIDVKGNFEVKNEPKRNGVY